MAPAPRRLPLSLAVALAAPGRWPDWYPGLWILAIGALALARRARGFVLTAAIVAACGAATLVWGTVAKKRVELAERDVAGLSAPDSTAQESSRLEWRGELEQGAAASSTRADLLDRYVRSDLDDAGYAAELTTWSSTEDDGPSRPDASLVLSEFRQDTAGGGIGRGRGAPRAARQ